jgi:hypothetical protein
MMQQIFTVGLAVSIRVRFSTTAPPPTSECTPAFKETASRDLAGVVGPHRVKTSMYARTVPGGGRGERAGIRIGSTSFHRARLGLIEMNAIRVAGSFSRTFSTRVR